MICFYKKYEVKNVTGAVIAAKSGSFYWVITWKLLFSMGKLTFGRGDKKLVGGVHWGIFLGGGEFLADIMLGRDSPHPPSRENPANMGEVFS